MPNYNLQLQSNNTDLQTVLQTLQTKAAGGGSIETVTGTVSNSGPILPGTSSLNGIIHYINANGAYATSNVIGTITVMKDSILCADSPDGVNISDNLVRLDQNYGVTKTCRVIGDFTVKI